MTELTFTTPDFGSSPKEYLQEVKAELKKVAWPSRESLIQSTTLVILVSVAVGAFLGGLDYLFTSLLAIIL